MKFERIQNIESYIQQRHSVTIDELCENFNVSKNTIRRDITILLERGVIDKIYGGVVSKRQNLLSSFDERSAKHQREKAAIGQKAASFVRPNDIIYVDSGTTAFQMVPYIESIQNITVLTNNLKVIVELAPFTDINVISIGGMLIRKTSSFAGVQSISAMKGYNISKCFMAASGVSIANGLTNSNASECDLKREAIERSAEIYVLADASKFDVSSLMTFQPLTGVNYIITDRQPADKYVDFCKNNQITLVVA
jgi:DeoR family myo-inositol catabolism operon transcriptional repressor